MAEAERRFAAGHTADVETICTSVLASHRDHPGALTLLGALAHRAGDMARAAGYFSRVEAAAPDDPRALVNHGVALLALGQAEAAIGRLERATALAPGMPDAWFNVARARQDLGRIQAAIAAYERAVALAPRDTQALNNLGKLLLGENRAGDAVRALARAVQLRPGYTKALFNLGEALIADGKADDALACFRRVLALEPENEAAAVRLGGELRALGRLDEAEAVFRDAVARHPSSSDAWGGLGVTVGALRRFAESEAAFRRVLALAPQSAGAHSDMLLGFDYRTDVTPERLFAEHRAWDAAHGERFRRDWPIHDNPRAADRPLRVGFVSPDFGLHPVGYLTIRMFEAIDRAAFATVLYAAKRRRDPLNDRFRAAAGEWVDADAMDDAALAARIRADRIDVLVDMAGHFAANRLPVFARKPAPVQVSWAGYPTTTGMAAMDWVIGDPLQVPVEAEPLYVERIMRLPETSIVFDPPGYAPPVAALPQTQRGFVTFAAFHNPAKINDGCAALWARVLAALPGSRIVFKYGGVDTPSTRAALTAVFAEHGIDATRIDFDRPAPHHELLARYGDCDIALDATPYSGSTTTCEALWMGVPVVAMPSGLTMFQRHSFAHLNVLGLPELIARDSDDFVRIAVALAHDRQKLAALRGGLRARIAASPLCDGPRFAGHFATALRAMWRDWAEREPGPAR